ncbi:MAG: TonB-dependent receptor, partial [Desulfovibrionaceae bacterium]|nr:TonB-dependent receptor [Desulfovibrionaceae bacterium]
TTPRYSAAASVVYKPQLYAQGETSLPKDFILNYGTRLSIITTGIDSHSGNAISISGYWPFPPTSFNIINTPIVTNTKERTYIHPVFSFGFMYTGFEDTTLRVSFAQGFRSPTLQERYMNTIGGGEAIFANASLKPETSHTIELGARYFANNFRIDVTPFYTFTENYITAQPTTASGSSAIYKNIGKAHTVGIEGDLRYTIEVANLTPYTTVTFIKRQFDYGAFTTWSTGTPEISGRFGLLYEKDWFEEYGFSFYADVFGNYASSTTYTQPDGAGRQILHVDSYITANIHTGIRFGSNRQFYLDIMANNIFNKKYISPISVRQVGAGYLYEPGTYVVMQIGAKF